MILRVNTGREVLVQLIGLRKHFKSLCEMWLATSRAVPESTQGFTFKSWRGIVRKPLDTCGLFSREARHDQLHTTNTAEFGGE